MQDKVCGCKRPSRRSSREKSKTAGSSLRFIGEDNAWIQLKIPPLSQKAGGSRIEWRERSLCNAGEGVSAWTLILQQLPPKAHTRIIKRFRATPAGTGPIRVSGDGFAQKTSAASLHHEAWVWLDGYGKSTAPLESVNAAFWSWARKRRIGAQAGERELKIASVEADLFLFRARVLNNR
jgi:hypothetical protein